MDPYMDLAQGVDTIVLGGRDVNARAYVATFNLKGTMQEKKVGMLSGGERGRFAIEDPPLYCPARSSPRIDYGSQPFS